VAVQCRCRRTHHKILRHLIAFDTTSRNSNLALIDYVRTYLDELGVPYRLTYDITVKKANLLAIIGDPDMPGGYVLSGHTDVVPVEGQIGRASCRERV